MLSFAVVAVMGLVAGLGAGDQGAIVFDRGAAAADLAPTFNLRTPSALFVIDLSEDEPEPVIVPGTRDGRTNIMPSWFPDRGRIVYVSNRDSGNRGQIWIATIASSNHTRLTDNDGNNFYPSVSADGSMIAFVSTADIDDGLPEEVDGGEEGEEGEVGEELPPLDPVEAAKPANLDLYVMSASGTGLHRLTNDAFQDREPAFSLDGETIYFVKEGVTPVIYSIPVDGEPGDETPVMGKDGFPLNGRDLSVFGDPLGDILCFKNLQGVLTTYDTFTQQLSTGATGLTRPFIGQDGSRLVHSSAGNLTITTLAGDVSRSLLLTGDVLFARWLSPGEMPLPDTITVITPNGGETWPQGATKTIEWTSGQKADETVKIELSKAGLKPAVIADDAENTGSFEWTIPEDQEVGNLYLITVSFKNDPSVADSSDSTFSIVRPQDCVVPDPPAQVFATDGQYGDRIEVSWTPVPGATKYEVYRNRIDSWSTAHLIDTVQTTNYIDTDTLPLIVQEGCRGPIESRANYYYFIKAVNDCGTSRFSFSDVGYRGVDTTEAKRLTGDALVTGAAALALVLARRRRRSR